MAQIATESEILVEYLSRLHQSPGDILSIIKKLCQKVANRNSIKFGSIEIEVKPGPNGAGFKISADVRDGSVFDCISTKTVSTQTATMWINSRVRAKEIV